MLLNTICVCVCVLRSYDVGAARSFTGRVTLRSRVFLPVDSIDFSQTEVGLQIAVSPDRLTTRDRTGIFLDIVAPTTEFRSEEVMILPSTWCPALRCSYINRFTAARIYVENGSKTKRRTTFKKNQIRYRMILKILKICVQSMSDPAKTFVN